MRRRAPSVLLVMAVIGLFAALPSAQAPNPASPPAAASSPVTFARDIEPIFAKSCWNCHSADAQLADLDLSTREAAIRGGEHGGCDRAGDARKAAVSDFAARELRCDGRLEARGGEIAAIKAGLTVAPSGPAP